MKVLHNEKKKSFGSRLLSVQFNRRGRFQLYLSLHDYVEVRALVAIVKHVLSCAKLLQVHISVQISQSLLLIFWANFFEKAILGEKFGNFRNIGCSAIFWLQHQILLDLFLFVIFYVRVASRISFRNVASLNGTFLALSFRFQQLLFLLLVVVLACRDWFGLHRLTWFLTFSII